ncbi:hypothetical protein BH10BAC4_BH10BAC4_12760 [soil metagenome]
MRIVLFILCATLLNCSSDKTEAPSPIGPLPNVNQLVWHDMELNAFVHFTTNTFTDKEWGYGDEAHSVFNPSTMNAEQWIITFKEAGFKGVILTCKHHDGFCLWPSEYTDHSVKASSWKNGKGDVVKDVADACRKHDLKFGIYLSPWDRNHKDYGKPEYVSYYRSQLKELFTNYGPVFEMWFDGANGGDGYYGGSREKRSINGATYYKWPATLDSVRKLEPNVIFFSDAGPGVRWVGNEKGVAGETNWNTISTDTLYAGKAGIEKVLNSGSENGTSWIPAEVDVSIRPGWFYHSREDSLVKSPERLFEIYLTSVGRGSTLLLNVPPDRRGLLHENDVASLQGFKKILDQEFKTNLAVNSKITASTSRGNKQEFSVTNVNDRNPATYWATADNVAAANIEINFTTPPTIKYVLLQEFLPLGQRVKSFSVEAWKENQWLKIAEGTTIGHKRILKFQPITTEKIRINFTESKGCLAISNVELY